MHFPIKDDFLKLAKPGALIPVCREIIADTETPVSAYSKIAGKYSFLLESIEGGENVARYSFLGCDPHMVFKSKGEKIQIFSRGKGQGSRVKGKPLNVLRDLLKQYEPVRIEGLPRFHGGAVGYIGYDMVRFIEDIPDKNTDDLKLPDSVFLFTDTILAFDHVKHKILVISNAHVQDNPSKAYDDAVKKIEGIIKKLRKPLKLKPLEIAERARVKPVLSSNISRQEYESSVSKAKEYIKSGDIIQVVLSQRFKSRLGAQPLDVYRKLRTVNPSPYMYFFNLDGFYLIGASPEVMVRLEGRTATVRPIAGTRPRGKDEDEDKKLREELLADEKERAEHIMLVDLARNDLGRVCEPSSIEVSDLMSVEKYSHVMHIVSNVKGQLLEGRDAFDLFSASFPAGTVTGAPKIRAMEIIDELESLKRGPYAGAVGYFDYYGGMDTCITIRTIVAKKSTAYIQAGAGIVFDSVPASEYQECRNKAGALLKAIGAQ